MDEIEPGTYVTLQSGGSGQVMATVSDLTPDRYVVRLTGTEIEEQMSIDQFKQVLTVKRQKE